MNPEKMVPNNTTPKGHVTDEPTADLMDKSEKIGKIFTYSPDLLCIVNTDGYFELVNPAFERTLGYTQSELLHQPFTELIHPEDREATLAEMQKLAEGTPLIEFDNRFRCSEGTYKWLSWTAQSMPDGTLYANARDITTRKATENAVRKSREQFRQSMDSAPIAIILVNQKGQIELVNRKTEEIFGYTRKELLGLSIESLIPQEYHHSHKGYQKQYFQFPTARAMGADRDLYGLRKNGSTFPLEIGLCPIHTEGALHVVVTIVDVTQRKRMEEALRAKTAALTNTNLELEQYAYVVSHDIQTPLRAIHNYAEFLAEDLEGRLEEEQQNYLQGLGKAVRQAQRLVNDLLGLTRMSKQNMNITRVSLNELLQEIIASFQKPGEVEITLAKEFPTLESEPTLLRQIFLNLITNGLKFNESATKRIEIGWSPAGDFAVEISIRDNGIGIEAEYHEKIFKAFERLHLQSEYEGSGIGLAIIKKAVNRLQGSIRLASASEEGSTFYITLPQKWEENAL